MRTYGRLARRKRWGNRCLTDEEARCVARDPNSDVNHPQLMAHLSDPLLGDDFVHGCAHCRMKVKRFVKAYEREQRNADLNPNEWALIGVITTMVVILLGAGVWQVFSLFIIEE